jgi:phage N-6-adenine-methyltransferase
MPQQKPGRSKQDYRTPPEFLAALKYRLDIEDFTCDVAATAENSVGLSYCEDGLEEPWARSGWNFCNPPYGHITPWVSIAWEETYRHVRTAMLVPASVGANWWANHVDGKAHVLFLNGRLTFQGCTAPYPKDLAVLLYTPYVKGGYEVWNWRK